MDRGRRDLRRLIEGAGFKIIEFDPTRGKGDHAWFLCEYNGYQVTIVSKPKTGKDPMSIVKFKADLSRAKREIDGKTTRSAGCVDHSNAGRSPGCIQIIGVAAPPRPRR